MKRLTNKRGSILILALVVMYVLIALSISFATANVNELNSAKRMYHSTAAFWIAEAGVNMYMGNPGMLDDVLTKEIDYGNGKIILTKDVSRPTTYSVTSKGIYGAIERTIKIVYPSNTPEAFKNTLTTSGQISITGDKTVAMVNGQTRVASTIGGSSTNADVVFEDVIQGVDSALTSLSYTPPTQNAAVSDLGNFMANNQEMLSGYSPDEVLYIKDASSVTLDAEMLKGKKIVYVEKSDGAGDVIINSNTIVEPNQHLTVISTGTVTFNQSGYQPPNSQLNIIAWKGYKETVSAASTHYGMVYTNGTATFDQIKDSSVSYGSIIAEGGINLGDIWSPKVFNYKDLTEHGYYPLGFERLRGGSLASSQAKPTLWTEVVK